MPSHAFHQLYYHIVWCAKNRAPVMVDELRERVIGWVKDECRKRGGTPVACNVMPDHVHLLVCLPPTATVSTFVGQVKGATSYAYNHHFGERYSLVWQDGYGVVTVRNGECDKVIRYIENQQSLHESGKASRLLETTEDASTFRRPGNRVNDVSTDVASADVLSTDAPSVEVPSVNERADEGRARFTGLRVRQE